jgi:hypothetical protein
MPNTPKETPEIEVFISEILGNPAIVVIEK